MNTSATADTIDLGKDDYAETKNHHTRKSCTSRGKWSKLEIATMVGGFILFWPVGLVALGAKLVKGEMWTGSKENVMPWTAYANWRNQNGNKPFNFSAPNWSQRTSSSGNAAFDAYKREQLDRLEAERRKLDEEQKAFHEHLAKLRRAKDQEEFDRFMAERNAPQPEQPAQ